MGVDEKFSELNPEAQNAVMAFIEFLLSRQSGEEHQKYHDGELRDDIQDEDVRVTNEYEKKSVSDQEKIDTSGIILAEERAINESEDLIDFADINTRFSPGTSDKDKSGPVRQRKMFDWM